MKRRPVVELLAYYRLDNLSGADLSMIIRALRAFGPPTSDAAKLADALAEFRLTAATGFKATVEAGTPKREAGGLE